MSAQLPTLLRNLGDFISLHTDEVTAAIVDTRHSPPRSWTFEQLRSNSEQVARALLGCGSLQKADRVGILAENSAEYLVAVSAVMKAGLTVVPMNFRLPQETISHIVSDAQCRLVFVDRELPHGSPISCPTIRLYGDDVGTLQHLARTGSESSERLPTVSDEQWACILYTSGSTGLPKGVILTHGSQRWSFSKLLPGFQPMSGNVTLIAAPYYHMNGLFISMLCIAAGIGIVLLPRFEPRGYLRALEIHQCAFLTGIPAMFAMLVRDHPPGRAHAFPCVRSIVMGSSPLSEKLAEEVHALFPNATLRNAFGTTEVGPYVFGAHPAGIPTPAVSLGCVAEGIEVKLIGGPSDDEGTLVIRSPAVMQAYLNMPAQSAQRLRNGWYYTGDVVRRDAAGFFYYVGRDDDMFVCGGENIYPSQIERLLERHPEVAQAAVIPIPDDIKGHLPVAFIVRQPGSTLTEEAVKQFALREGPTFSHPRHVHFLDALPVGSSLKYDRNALLARALFDHKPK